MINVALVSHSPHLWGAERSLINLADLYIQKPVMFNKKSNQIHPILMVPVPEDGGMSTVAQENKIEMIYTPSNPWYIYQSPNKSQDFKVFCEKIKQDTQIFIELFKKTEANIVLINTLTNFIPHIAAYKLGLPIITWIHGMLDPAIVSGVDAYYKDCIDKSIIKLSDKIIFNSKWTEKQFEKISESFVISNWTVEPSVHQPYDKSSNKFICLNSMESKKGHKVLLDAVKILKDSGCRFHVSLYGTGYEVPNIINQINNSELNDFVSIYPPTVNVSKLYNECAALVQPSLYESFGRTIIEAMSYKRPVIAAATADPENIIADGKSGFRIEPGNSKKLAEKMFFIMNNSLESKKMGKRGYKIFKSRFNGNIARKKITELIYEIYEANTKPTSSQQFAFDTLNIIHKGSVNQI